VESNTARKWRCRRGCVKPVGACCTAPPVVMVREEPSCSSSSSSSSSTSLSSPLNWRECKHVSGRVWIVVVTAHGNCTWRMIVAAERKPPRELCTLKAHPSRPHKPWRDAAMRAVSKVTDIDVRSLADLQHVILPPLSCRTMSALCKKQHSTKPVNSRWSIGESPQAQVP